MADISALEQDVQPKKSSKTKRLLSLFIKLLLTAACFWYISTKIDFRQAFQALTSANILLLVASTLLYAFSKLISAYRLNIYFRNIQLHLPHTQNLRLYWVGMFYNLFLPGAISGDAYKVILLRRHFHTSYKQLTTAVLLDRFSGLLGLGIILCGLGIFLFDSVFLKLLFAIVALAGIGIFYLLISRFFMVFRQSFFPTLTLGLAVQAIQVAGVYLLLQATGVDTKNTEWLFIFLAAQIATVLPISLGGGLGTREVLFAEGARYFGLNPATGVAVSLLFYLSSVAASLWGVRYVFQDPLKGLRQPDSPVDNK